MFGIASLSAPPSSLIHFEFWAFWHLGIWAFGSSGWPPCRAGVAGIRCVEGKGWSTLQSRPRRTVGGLAFYSLAHCRPVFLRRPQSSQPSERIFERLCCLAPMTLLRNYYDQSGRRRPECTRTHVSTRTFVGQRIVIDRIQIGTEQNHSICSGPVPGSFVTGSWTRLVWTWSAFVLSTLSIRTILLGSELGRWGTQENS